MIQREKSAMSGRTLAGNSRTQQPHHNYLKWKVVIMANSATLNKNSSGDTKPAANLAMKYPNAENKGAPCKLSMLPGCDIKF